MVHVPPERHPFQVGIHRVFLLEWRARVEERKLGMVETYLRKRREIARQLHRCKDKKSHAFRETLKKWYDVLPHQSRRIQYDKYLDQFRRPMQDLVSKESWRRHFQRRVLNQIVDDTNRHFVVEMTSQELQMSTGNLYRALNNGRLSADVFSFIVKQCGINESDLNRIVRRGLILLDCVLECASIFEYNTDGEIASRRANKEDIEQRMRCAESVVEAAVMVSLIDIDQMLRRWLRTLRTCDCDLTDVWRRNEYLRFLDDLIGRTRQVLAEDEIAERVLEELIQLGPKEFTRWLASIWKGQLGYYLSLQAISEWRVDGSEPLDNPSSELDF